MQIYVGRIYVRTNSSIIVFEESQSLKILKTIRLSIVVPQTNVSMVETDTGFFIYAINDVYYVTNPYDQFRINSTVL